MKKNLLSYVNDWEAYRYYVNGNKEIAQLKEVEIAGMKYKVHSRVISIPYSDHGHTYDGTSRHYFIYTYIGSAKVEIPISKILNTKQEPIYALKFKLYD